MLTLSGIAKRTGLAGLRTRRARRRLSDVCTRITPQEIPERRAPNDSRIDLRVLWVLAGDERLGSARVKGFMISRLLRERFEGVWSAVAWRPEESARLTPDLCWEPATWRALLDRGVDVVCLQTRRGATADLLRDCRERGISTIFSISDRPVEATPREIYDLADAVAVSSEPLADDLRAIHQRVVLIEDPIEAWGRERVDMGRGRDPELVWLGAADHWPHVEFLRRTLDCPELKGATLRTISAHPEATRQWSPETVWADAATSDIAVIPCDTSEAGAAKSSNRLVSFLAMGYPVVATPIPSYRAHLSEGVNGFFATSIDELREALTRLRDPDLRARMSEAALATPTLPSIAPEAVAGRWLELFRELRGAAPARKIGAAS